MSNNESVDWTTEDPKTEAVYKVLKYLAENPDDGAACVGNDQKAHELFERVGGIKIPPGQRVILFGSGEKKLEFRGSVVLEVPYGVTQLNDDQLKTFVLGNYSYWRPPTA
jgi:hypothetical protein